MLETERLILRKWTEEEAESLFEYAKIRRSDLLQDGRRIRVWRKAELSSKMYLMEQSATQSVKRKRILR